MSVRQRRYEPSRSSRERDHRYDGGGDRSRDRSDSSYNYKESVSEAGKSSGSSSSRHKTPLLQFTTDINPACFSGPITFPVVGGNRSSSSSYRSMEPYSPDSHTNEYSLDRKFGRRDGSHRSSYNDSVDDDRKIHRFRDNRERDRDRMRERDRTRERERDRSRDRDSDRIERDRDRGREREWREEIPNNTIMIRCLDPTVSETDLRNEVTRYGLEPKDIRLIREKDTGASRGFAFVEFQLLSEAVRWKELTKSVVLFNGQHRATLHYSIPKDILGAERVLLNKADWDCTKCGMSNFRRRDYCFKCNSPREETSDGRHCEGYNEISSSPSNTLLFRNLDVLTTEERVLAMLGQLTTLPIKSLRVAKDSLTNTSRGFAFVELHSTTEATQLHDLLLTMTGNFYVDGRQVTVSYAKRSLTSMNSAASANAAVVALAAAQWTNQESECSPLSQFSPISEKDISQDLTVDSAGSSQTQLSSLGTVVVQGVTHKKYPLPDISTYQYDESSGFYYDNSTGLYYDANSQYYYNSDTQQYLYWDGDHHTFLAAQSTGLSSSSHIQSENVLASTSVSASSPDVNHDGESQDKSKRKEEKLDKVKIAKKIAKDMERWAKTLNQKKENAKLGIVASPFTEVLPPIFMMNDASKQSAAADAGFAILEKRTSLAERNALITEVLKHKEMENKLSFSVTTKEKPVLVASYGEDSDSGSEVDSIQEEKKGLKSNRSDESRLTDWSKLACLLCKRQFPTREALCRHQQLSDLHKKNLVKFSAAADQT